MSKIRFRIMLPQAHHDDGGVVQADLQPVRHFLVGATLLSSVLAAVVGFIAFAIKKLGCIPIYILRFIFYCGWTFVLPLILAGIAALRHFFPFALLF